MKKKHMIYSSLVLVILIGFSSLKSIDKKEAKMEEIDMPENVKAVVDNKCFGCHSEESQSDKAKEKLRWDQLDQLSKAKLVTTFGNIEEVLDKGKMPPEKFLERRPEKKLTDEERQILKSWVVSSAENLMK
jgi:uncharacterized membrane protein